MKVAGRVLRSEDLTPAQILELEQATGKRWSEFRPYASAGDALALVLAMLAASRVEQPGTLAESLPWAQVVQWLEPVEPEIDDIVWRDGIPKMGGRTFDDYVAIFGCEPWCWPPDVTRRQRVRDLDLLLESASNRPKPKGRR